MAADGDLGTAVVVGADRAFGAEIVAGLTAAGYRTSGVPADAKVLRATVDALASVEVLVINVPTQAGAQRFLDISDAEFDLAMRDSLFDVLGAGQAVLPRMPRGGRIVTVASRGHLGAWGGAHLMAASAAVLGLNRSMALELVERGIRVNVVAPDFIGGKWDTPDDRASVADAAIFLAAPGNRQLTGETMLLDGARSLRMSESRRR